MSAVLESLEQQYAAEVLKPDADEDLLKRDPLSERSYRAYRSVLSWSAVSDTIRTVFLHSAAVESMRTLSLSCRLRVCC